MYDRNTAHGTPSGTADRAETGRELAPGARICESMPRDIRGFEQENIDATIGESGVRG